MQHQLVAAFANHVEEVVQPDLSLPVVDDLCTDLLIGKLGKHVWRDRFRFQWNRRLFFECESDRAHEIRITSKSETVSRGGTTEELIPLHPRL